MSETFDGREIDVTSRDKLFFPDVGVSKGDLIDYYARIYPYMKLHLAGRPISFERYPDGIDGTHFFQKNASDYFPEWIRTVRLEKQDGEVEYIVVQDRPTLVFLADQAALAIHVFLSTVQHPHRPDRFIFDLDPPGDGFSPVRRAALNVREAIEEAGLHPLVMTTGSKGLHVTTPIHPEESYDDVRAFARRVAERAVAAHPDELTLEQRVDQRRGRVYLDIIRNAYGQTGICPYSVRATSRASVAAPLDWDEVGDGSLRPDKYTVRNLFRRLGQKDDPWSQFRERAESLRRAVRRL